MDFRLVAAFILAFVFATNLLTEAQQKTDNLSPAVIQERLAKVPVLCYHQIRDWTNSDSKSSKVYIMPPATFKNQLAALQREGYHSISPEQLMAYAYKGMTLPPKPILLTFDDGSIGQYEVALPELQKAKYTATFFIMTVSINRPHYMSKDMIKDLVSKGYDIGCHTWNHEMVTKYTTPEDWNKQLTKPTKELQVLTGRRMIFFAYPDGLYNDKAFQPLKNAHYVAAFQLWGKIDETEPFLCIRRMIADGLWSGTELLQQMKARYHN